MRLDGDRLDEVIRAAETKAGGDLRWQVAIAKAKAQFESNPYLHWDGVSLLVLSPSNRIYRAGRGCQCASYRRGHPCWHRAAARLMLRYAESLAGQ